VVPQPASSRVPFFNAQSRQRAVSGGSTQAGRAGGVPARIRLRSSWKMNGFPVTRSEHHALLLRYRPASPGGSHKGSRQARLLVDDQHAPKRLTGPDRTACRPLRGSKRLAARPTSSRDPDGNTCARRTRQVGSAEGRNEVDGVDRTPQKIGPEIGQDRHPTHRLARSASLRRLRSHVIDRTLSPTDRDDFVIETLIWPSTVLLHYRRAVRRSVP